MKVLIRSPFWRRGFRALGLRLFRLAENNDDPRMECNGEAWLLRSLISADADGSIQGRAFVVYDAGANAGDYSASVLQAAACLSREVELHVFEPSPVCVEKLHKRFSGVAAVKITCAALSDHDGFARLHGGKSGSSQAFLAHREGTVATEESIEVPIFKLGDYLSSAKGARVDLLKLDVEGSELVALRGLGEWLRPEVISVIQFEYGGPTLNAGVSLRHLFELLEDQGYVLAKLLPAALEVRTYKPWMENYAYANYVALSPRLLPEGCDR